MTLTINQIKIMKIKNLFFLKAENNQIEAWLTIADNDKVETICETGVSRKQAIFNLCKQGKLAWNLFAEAKELASKTRDPRSPKRTFVSRESVRDRKLADICDDMRCSVAEAVAFLDRGVMPCGW